MVNCLQSQVSTGHCEAYFSGEFRVSGFGFRVLGFGFRVSGFGFQVTGFRFQVSDSRFQVSGFGFHLLGLGFRVSGACLFEAEVSPRAFVTRPLVLFAVQVARIPLHQNYLRHPS